MNHWYCISLECELILHELALYTLKDYYKDEKKRLQCLIKEKRKKIKSLAKQKR